MSDQSGPLDNAGDYMKHCTKCPHFSRREDGASQCAKIEGGGYGQLPTLVKEGMPCPVGKFGADEQKPKPKPKPEPKPEPEVESDEPHFIFKILESCKSATFHFEDGDLTWTKK